MNDERARGLLPTLLAAIIIGLGIASLWLYGYTLDGSYSAFAQARFESQWENIRAVNARRTDEHWAGSYRGSAGTFEISSDAFVFTEYPVYCSPGPFNFGVVRDKDGTIELEFFYEPTRKKVANTYIPVHWRDRAYLVEEEGMLDFCSMVNGALRAPEGTLTRDRKLSGVIDRPTVPARFKKYLLDEPVHTRIIAVHDSSDEAESGGRIRRVTLDEGTDGGLLVGMHVVTAEDKIFTFVIESSTAHECVAILNQQSPSAGGLQIGWRVTTDKHPSW